MEKILASFSRNLYIIPGGYFIVQLLRKLYPVKSGSSNLRTFTFQGLRMEVDISKSMGAAIYWRGAHDWRPIFILKKFLRKGDTFVDIGANQGEYTLWALRKIGPEGKVIAFEPMDLLYDQLIENIKLNPDFEDTVLPIKMGLSNQSGEIRLYGREGDNEGVNTIFPTASHKVLIQKIPLDTLDAQLLALKCQSLDFIKIDVEGAELQVLQGAEKTLNRFQPKLLIEINREACLAAGYEAQDILNFLKQRNYSLYEIGLRGKLSTISNFHGSFCNVLALPISKKDEN